MKCPVCKNGKMEQKKIDYQAKIKGEYVVVKNVEEIFYELETADEEIKIIFR